jgi:hypothetical protein
LCTRLARARESRDLSPVLGDATRLLGAVGLVLWLWDSREGVLRAAVSHGFSPDVLAQLGGVSLDGDNAIAAAFRGRMIRVVSSGASQTGAIVVPLVAASSCPGVLAVELRDGGERDHRVRAFATILAAQLSMLVSYPAGVQTPEQ